MAETVNATEVDRQAREEWRKNGYTCEGAWLLLDQAFARHRIEATRQAEADRAELVEALAASNLKLASYMLTHDDLIGSGLVKSNNDLLAKHGGRDAGTDNAG